MKRRQALQTLSASLGAVLVLPDWAHAWSRQSLDQSWPGNVPRLLTADQTTLLTDIVSTIIPEGQVVGAKGVGVPAFIEKMIADCYEQPAQTDFKNGLAAIDSAAQAAYGKPFVSLQSAEKLAVLTAFAQTTDATQKEFFGLLKNLTIQGYTTSEYVLVNHLKYDMAPGHYYGCVNV
ncbi:gluconate 2-dehydrogenase subunit 3 family protein [Fibrella sp. WM1]|uniref:gluconate 2-dehydrogenase subunit 3 family protein n=1 Tax=Fibrella musci TaxID=3242485 RepID=UPI0035217BE7